MNTISERQQRYEHRCLQQKYRDQKVNRQNRFDAREQLRDSVKSEVTQEMETRKRSGSMSKPLRRSLRVMSRV
jgi:hypothetical protein